MCWVASINYNQNNLIGRQLLRQDKYTSHKVYLHKIYKLTNVTRIFYKYLTRTPRVTIGLYTECTVP